MERARRKQKRTGKEWFVRKLQRELEKNRASLAEEARQKKNGKKQKAELLQIGYEVLFQKADSLSDEVLLGLLGQSSGILENACQEKRKWTVDRRIILTGKNKGGRYHEQATREAERVSDSSAASGGD